MNPTDDHKLVAAGTRRVAKWIQEPLRAVKYSVDSGVAIICLSRCALDCCGWLVQKKSEIALVVATTSCTGVGFLYDPIDLTCETFECNQARATQCVERVHA